MEEKKKWWVSSADPTKISLTLKSFVPLVIFGLGFLGAYNVTENDMYGFIEALITAVAALGAVYGAGRKIYKKAKA